MFSLFLLVVASSCRTAELQPASTLAELQQQLRDYISQSKYAAALWGVKVVSLDTGKLLFEFNENKLLTPASNTKLYTAALALDRLGSDYRIKSSIYARNKPDESGTVSGDVIVYGRGDPSVNARLHKGGLEDTLLLFVKAISQAKVKRIAGDLIADCSYFQGPAIGSGWLTDDLQHAYGAEISALSVNDNILRVRVTPGERAGAACHISVLPGSAIAFMRVNNRTITVEKGGARTLQLRRHTSENVLDASGQMTMGDAAQSQDIPVHNPAALFAFLLSDALKRHGIELLGKARSVDCFGRQANPVGLDTFSELGAVESPPLRHLIKETLKISQNLYSDLLLAHIGERSRSPETSQDATSEQLGIHELGNFLVKAGIPPNEVLFEEGSGLSRNNAATPNATVALLQFMARQACSNVFFEALPIAGVDGTLQNRMKNTVAQGHVRAKTGTFNRDSSLSGQMQTASGEHLVFSIMLNRYSSVPGHSGADVDPIAVMLAKFRGRSL